MRAVESAVRRIPARTVADIMAAPVVTVTPAMTIGEARRLQRESQVRHLPVLEGDLLVGIVSDGDLRRASDESVEVADVMTRTVIVLSPETPLRVAERVFRQRRFGAMPVLEGRELVGIASVVDVARALEERLTVDPGDRSC